MSKNNKSKSLASLLAPKPSTVSTTTTTTVSTGPKIGQLFSEIPAEFQGDIRALPPEERLFIVGFLGANNVNGIVDASKKLNNYGFKDYRESSIYLKSKDELDSLIRNLSNILQVMAGETKSDFRRIIQTDKTITVEKPKDTKLVDLDKDSVMKLNLGSGEQKFPEYNSNLAEYASGRYESGLAKPLYRNMEYMMNYFEKGPLSRDLFNTYIQDPIKQIVGKQEYDRDDIKRALELYQGDTKFDFKYIPSERAQSIFRRLKAIYLDLLKIQESEDKKRGLSEDLVPRKTINLYISDYILKRGNLLTLAEELNAPHILNSLEIMNAQNYTQWYVNIRNLHIILNAVLGEMNWTVEVTYSKQFDGKLMIRGYYVDMLGNFKYGQLITDRTVFGNSDVNQDATMKSLLARTLITDTFQALHGLSENEYKEIQILQRNYVTGGFFKGLQLWKEWKSNEEVPKFVETASIKPIKRQSEAIDYKPEKRAIDEFGSFEKEKEKVKQDAPKEITHDPKAVIIEEMK